MRIRSSCWLLVAVAGIVLAGAGCTAVPHAGSVVAVESASLAADSFPVGEARAIPVHEPLLAAAGGMEGFPPNSIDVGLLLAYVMYGDITVGNTDVEIDEDIAYGVRVGYHIDEKHGIETAFVFSNLAAKNRPEETDLFTWQIGYLYHFILSNPQLIPYLTIGTGFFDHDRDSGAILYGGGGLRYQITENLFARLDIQIVQGFGDDDSDPNFVIGLGADWNFGSLK